jgi:hypothetical protein
MAGFHIIVGVKSQIRSALMNKEQQMTTMNLMKTEIFFIELNVEEKKRPRPI